MMRWFPVVGNAAVLLAAVACTSSLSGTPSGGGTYQPRPTRTATQPSQPTRVRTSTMPTSPPHSSPTSTAPRAAAGPAQQALNRMNLAERVGQLLMVDCPSSGASASTVESIHRYHAGSVILDGNSTLGVARTRAVTQHLQSLAPARVGLFVATDQEGGYVQRLKGPGFDSIPSAVVQGSWAVSRVDSFTRQWGAELSSAGLNVDLAPVLDTVPPGNRSNPPIGDLDREYGRTPTRVASRGVAVVKGLAAAGVDATAKHFPGLGRVTGNTDTTSGVVDTVTTRNDPYLLPFRTAVQNGVPFVMVSSAEYRRIDPGVPAVFSRTIITTMLRGDLGFRGVIITDDIGAAAQVASVPPGIRAVRFIQAGGTMVLTVAPDTVAAMATRLVDRAQANAAFRRLVNTAALTVLRAKAARGLLH